MSIFILLSGNVDGPAALPKPEVKRLKIEAILL